MLAARVMIRAPHQIDRVNPEGSGPQHRSSNLMTLVPGFPSRSMSGSILSMGTSRISCAGLRRSFRYENHGRNRCPRSRVRSHHPGAGGIQLHLLLRLPAAAARDLRPRPARLCAARVRCTATGVCPGSHCGTPTILPAGGDRAPAGVLSAPCGVRATKTSSSLGRRSPGIRPLGS